MDELKSYVEELVKKASKADKSEDAMRFSQSACNVCNVMAVLDNIKRATDSK